MRRSAASTGLGPRLWHGPFCIYNHVKLLPLVGPSHPISEVG